MATLKSLAVQPAARWTPEQVRSDEGSKESFGKPQTVHRLPHSTIASLPANPSRVIPARFTSASTASNRA